MHVRSCRTQLDPVLARMTSAAYVSTLLQAVALESGDLQDMFAAQLACLQQARPGRGGESCRSLMWLYIVYVHCPAWARARINVFNVAWETRLGAWCCSICALPCVGECTHQRREGSLCVHWEGR